MQRNDGATPDLGVKVARVTKRVGDAGPVFEVVESSDDHPARVVYRREGLAPIESYATGIPLGPPVLQPNPGD